MDMQTNITANLPTARDTMTTTAEAITHARKFGIPVIYVVVAFRPTAPEVSPHNKGFAARIAENRGAGPFSEDQVTIAPEVAPLPDDAIVKKRRISAFAGSDLEILLRSQGIQSLVLTGFSTSGVVLSTLREAADRDYEITVLSDCCGDSDPEVHNLLMSKLFPRQAGVMTAAQRIGTH